MESSTITAKWSSSVDNSFYKFNMTLEEKTQKVKVITAMIVDLKKNPSVEAKQTIQKLQQEIDNIIKQ